MPTDERILLASEKVFGAEGYVSARLEDIAAAAGIRRPSLLYYFSTKEKLYGALVHRLFGDLRQQLEQVMLEDAAFGARLVSLAMAFQEFAMARPAFGQIVLRDILDHREPVFQLLQDELVPVLDLVCAFVATYGSDLVRPNLPVRAAIVQYCTSTLLHAGAGPLREPLWGHGGHAEALVRATFLREDTSKG